MGETDRTRYAEAYVDLYPQVIEGCIASMKYNQERGEKQKSLLPSVRPLRPQRSCKAKILRGTSSRSCPIGLILTLCRTTTTGEGPFGLEDLRTQLRGYPRSKNICVCERSICRFYMMVLCGSCGCRCKETEFDDLVVGNIQQNSLKTFIGGPRHKKSAIVSRTISCGSLQRLQPVYAFLILK